MKLQSVVRVRVADASRWSGREGFNAQSLAPWYSSPSNRTQAGIYRTYGNLTFATVHECV